MPDRMRIPMMTSTRGAARVSAVWIIAVGVLFLVAIAFAFIAQNDLAAERRAAAAADVARAAALENEQKLATERRGVSEVLGWYNPESADPASDPRAARAALEALKTTFTDLGASDVTFERAIPKIIAMYNARGAKIAELEARAQALENEVTVQRNAVAQVQTEKDAQIAQLRQQLADETQNLTSQKEEAERRLAAATTQLSDRDNELRQVRVDSQAARRTLEQELLKKNARIGELAEATKFAREPFNQYPDGKIIEVSDALNVAWIDLGANHRVTRGMRFQVQDGRPGRSGLKAWAEVRRVDQNSAEVLISGVRDPFDPVVKGDAIINPLFDPAGGRNAVLVGRFSGAYNERDLTLLLQRMGIQVQPRLDLTTHFLIVGSELYNDPDTNEPLEEPIQPSELAVYKEAEANGVQIIPLQDIREFFRVDSLPQSTGAGSSPR